MDCEYQLFHRPSVAYFLSQDRSTRGGSEQPDYNLIICTMIPPPKDYNQQAAKVMQENGTKFQDVSDKLMSHQRGNFPAIPMGLSHGGGQKVRFSRFQQISADTSKGARHPQATLQASTLNPCTAYSATPVWLQSSTTLIVCCPSHS